MMVQERCKIPIPIVVRFLMEVTVGSARSQIPWLNNISYEHHAAITENDE